jgi:FAD binding domain
VNCGLQDAVNLAWKLALVYKGAAVRPWGTGPCQLHELTLAGTGVDGFSSAQLTPAKSLSFTASRNLQKPAPPHLSISLPWRTLKLQYSTAARTENPNG